MGSVNDQSNFVLAGEAFGNDEGAFLSASHGPSDSKVVNSYTFRHRRYLQTLTADTSVALPK